MVRGEIEQQVIVEENKITRDSKSKSVINKYTEKLFRFDYDKGVIVNINSDRVRVGSPTDSSPTAGSPTGQFIDKYIFEK
jgi:hypothetical protein